MPYCPVSTSGPRLDRPPSPPSNRAHAPDHSPRTRHHRPRPGHAVGSGRGDPAQDDPPHGLDPSHGAGRLVPDVDRARGRSLLPPGPFDGSEWIRSRGAALGTGKQLRSGLRGHAMARGWHRRWAQNTSVQRVRLERQRRTSGAGPSLRVRLGPCLGARRHGRLRA